MVSIETFREELEKRGHQVFIFAPKQPGFKDQNPHVFRIPSLAIPNEKNYHLALPFLSSLFWFPQIFALDIIHLQHIFTMSTLGLNIARRLKIPAVLTYHTKMDDYVHHFPLASYIPPLREVLKRYVIKRGVKVANQCRLVITPSPSMAQEVRGYGVKKPVVALPTGIYLERFKKQKSDSRILRLLYVGRLSEEKNIKMMLLTFKEVLKEVPKTQLLIIGDGPNRKDYEKLVRRLKIEPKVIFKGFLSKEETEKYFGMVDLFVFPSLTDTQGIVVVESLAAGTPVVVVDRLGPGDIVINGKVGFKTKPNVDNFSQKIILLLKNPTLRKQMGENARKEAQKYSAQTTAVKLEKLYYQILPKWGIMNF